MNTVNIYYLEDNKVIFYIGKTKNLLSKRLNEHRIKLKNYNINIELLDQVETNNWKFWEKYYISLFKTWGFNLTNKNSGGGGASILTDEIKKAISVRNKGNKYALGNKLSEETKKRIGLSNKGKNRPGAGPKNQKRDIKIFKNIIRPVAQISHGNLIKKYGSITEAKKTTGIKGIANVVSGRCKFAGGFEWIYLSQTI